MAIYGWGHGIHSFLELYGNNNEKGAMEQEIEWEEAPVRKVACGQYHTLFLTENGRLFYHLNHDSTEFHHMRSKRSRLSFFQRIIISKQFITQICCGANHSVALSAMGKVFCWGQNNCGQIGQSTRAKVVWTPRLVKDLESENIVQIASGSNHVLALTSGGELYSWGNNEYGQLGVGRSIQVFKSAKPLLVKSLFGVPLALISCGHNHSFAISKSGAVFSWGYNNQGQLGLNDKKNRFLPTEVKSMRKFAVRYIACGAEFSAFLTKDGSLFTCGSGTSGQLGHNKICDEMVPRKVKALEGHIVSQVACGSNYTFATVACRRSIYVFGVDMAAYLWKNNNNDAEMNVRTPWIFVSEATSFMPSDSVATESPVLRRIFAGVDMLFITTWNKNEIKHSVDSRFYKCKSQILTLTRQYCEKYANIKTVTDKYEDLIADMKTIFSSFASINGSFLLDTEIANCSNPEHHGVDLDEAMAAFNELENIQNKYLRSTISQKVINELMCSLTFLSDDVEALRSYLILPIYHQFKFPERYRFLHTPFSNKVLGLFKHSKHIIDRWWAEAPIAWFKQLLLNYKNVVDYIITEDFFNDIAERPHLIAALNMMSYLEEINKSRKDKLNYKLWILENLDCNFDVPTYINWIYEKNKNEFNIFKYPFIFNSGAKTKLLRVCHTLQKISHTNQISESMTIFPLSALEMRYAPINMIIVSRETLISDTLKAIKHLSQCDMKKKLVIGFVNEEGVDGGGIRNEFFGLVIKEILDVKYGMVKEFDESHFLWFSDLSFESSEMFALIGTICGLATFNSVIINLSFPLALYKKLLGVPVDITDLRDVSPYVAKSMQYMLDYDKDDFSDVFDFNFEITKTVYGKNITTPLKPNGSNIIVTKENRSEFVDLYIDFIFNKSVEMQFKAFKDGFMMVCKCKALEFFRPKELLAVVAGGTEYNWLELQQSCQYNGYNASSLTITWFWEVFHNLPESDKIKFLLFLTGSDRIPSQGLAAIKIVIARTSCRKRLPVAHTCLNLLDLPRYATKAELESKLKTAIQYTYGFGIA